VKNSRVPGDSAPQSTITAIYASNSGLASAGSGIRVAQQLFAFLLERLDGLPSREKEIVAAAERQRERTKRNRSAASQRARMERIQQLQTELQQAEERNKLLIARLNLVEVNAARLGIDPEELYQPILKPIRTASRSGSRSR
jgi:cell shape-determining protein MreC